MLSNDVFAKALLQRAESKHISVDNLKLQKLTYYCQGYHLAIYKEPAFDGEICAWEHGPVVSELYNTYRGFGSTCIISQADTDYFSEISESVQHIVDWVLETYGRVGSWTLRNKTHQERPWLSHYDSETCKADNRVITHTELQSFFKENLVAAQDSYLAALLDSVESEAIDVPEHIQNEDQFYAWIMDDSQS
ncbi:Panacea domain-containing protein [Pseudidiomarina marina]|nr:type II toxin-antitoxin system antitoxin SocA domain-containing protein [Pseudidiomarina marina]